MDGGVENSQIKNNPEKENVRKAFFALGIEFAILFVVLCAVLAAFNYFGILSLSKMYPSLFGFLPSKEKALTGKSFTGVDPNLPAQTPIPQEVDYDSNAKPTVEAVSDIADYKLILEDKEKLMGLLNSWGTFEKEYTPRYGAIGSTGGYPLKTITIHLVDTDQGTNAFGRGSQDIYSSSLTKISPGRFDVYIYVEKPMFEDQVKNFNPGSVFRVTLLSSLYKITHPYSNKTDADKVRSDLSNVFKENPLMRVDYFVIDKK